MVIAAYLAGLCTLPATGLGVWLGLRWWRALRRSEGVLGPEEPGVAQLPPAPPPPAPQGSPVISRISFASIPGRRRSIRRHR